MKSNYIPTFFIAIAVIAIASCKSENGSIPTGGKADFSRYIAVGNSLTSGFADGGLYLEGQQNSYPEILAAQMKAVGGGEFTTPLFNASQSNGSGHLKLVKFNADGTPVIEKVTNNLAVRDQIVIGGNTVTLFTKYQGAINNYGVPGISLSQVTLAPYGNFNGFFERLLPNNAPNNTTTYLDFVVEKPFTFFTCWLGNNDILGYATAGAASPVPPTEKALFNTLYNQVITTLTAKGAKGVAATIPDVTKTAFFTTVTLPSLLKAVQATAPTIKELYIQTGKTTVRAATDQDLFVLDFASAGLLGKPNSAGQPYGLTPENPIENKFVLDVEETVYVKNFITSYNDIIKAVAKAKNIAVYDAFTDLNEIVAGKTINGLQITGEFIKGNLFSLDGIHQTPMGYAIVANGFIKVINEKYGANLKPVDISKFRAVQIPK